MIVSYLRENIELVIMCLIIGIILPTILDKVKNLILSFCRLVQWILIAIWNSESAMAGVLILEVGFEVLLLQQWVFTYRALNEDSNIYAHYSYLPLTFIVPVFFTNACAFVLTICRLKDLDEK